MSLEEVEGAGGGEELNPALNPLTKLLKGRSSQSTARYDSVRARVRGRSSPSPSSSSRARFWAECDAPSVSGETAVSVDATDGGGRVSVFAEECGLPSTIAVEPATGGRGVAIISEGALGRGSVSSGPYRGLGTR